MISKRQAVTLVKSYKWSRVTKHPPKQKKIFVEYYKHLESIGAVELPKDFKSIYGTNLRGTFFQNQVMKEKVYKSKTDEPQILVQDLDKIERFGAKYDKRDIDSRSFLERLKALFGYDRDDFSLAEEGEEGTFPHSRRYGKTKNDARNGENKRRA